MTIVIHINSFVDGMPQIEKKCDCAIIKSQERPVYLGAVALAHTE